MSSKGTARTGNAHAIHLSGVGVCPGRVAGPVKWVVEPPEKPLPDPPRDDPRTEAARIRPAAEAVAARLTARATTVRGDAKAMLETTAAMAVDPALLGQAEQAVIAYSCAAVQAVYEAANNIADQLAAAGTYLAERVRDVHDVRDRIVAELSGLPAPGVPELTEPTILAARDLAPADTADLDPELVLALITEEGGPTSHTAILARALGLPAVVAVRGLCGHTKAVAATVNGQTGAAELSPTPVPTTTARHISPAKWSGTGATADGSPVAILANIGSVSDALSALDSGAEGIGLFRTEFCYLSASTEPEVTTQRKAYAEVLTTLAGKPVVVRTLDAGADKPLPFLYRPDEPNPALGVRGLRVGFENPGVLDRQLDAIAQAEAESGARVAVMAPMVATAEEAAWFTDRAHSAGVDRAGVMLEVPAAALSAAEILSATDFVSLGTNDLAQYTFAADRTTGALAALNDPWQPALLRLIAGVGEAATRQAVPAGVCGEAASDPLLAAVLIGLGITSLSTHATAIPAVGTALAAYSQVECQRAAQAVLHAPDSTQARETAATMLEAT